MFPPNKWAIIAGVILSFIFFNPGYAFSPTSEDTYCNADFCLTTDGLSVLNAKDVIGIVSAYNPVSWQCDSTPTITASNKKVFEGVVANNCLPFGTILDIAGELYIVEDRMNKRYGCEHFDIMMWDYQTAKEFGRQKLEIIIYN